MFKVIDYMEAVYTVYAVRSGPHGDAEFLIYNDFRECWEWRFANNFKPIDNYGREII